MDELQIGDHVLVGPGMAEPVFMFSHQHIEARSNMVRIDTEDASLELSAGHYLPIQGQLLAAHAVRVGDLITMGTGTEARVVRTSVHQKRGLFHPHTPSGKIVVNGVLATTYTRAVPPRLAKLLLYVPMMLYRYKIYNPLQHMFLRDNRWIASFVPRGAVVNSNI
eukprot:Plantae.Rhodophyta-Purpureofilum_apyrenoidigerum.ctg51815.p1 GENE.Plantae.Rhodophyta-Purpureofilum_apyrenoidigerum.ctg51815~~Plantae.Rhodophyta-Purpureofilum_apyrenoidigerum.ctg51815.p1  ORF type:complete len:174 (+),score=19.69 Plantae.Rhodophyta-Purpureofilum_apyrenoidigerum.ctg51815:28-522(+)